MTELTDEMISEYLAKISNNGMEGIKIFLPFAIGALLLTLFLFITARMIEDKTMKSMAALYLLGKITGTIGGAVLLFSGVIFLGALNNAKASDGYEIVLQKIEDKKKQTYAKRVYDGPDDNIGRTEEVTEYTILFDTLGERNVYSEQYQVGGIGDEVYVVMYQDKIKVMYNAGEYTYTGSRLIY